MLDIASYSGTPAPVANGYRTPLIGGLPAAPTYPLTATQLTSGFTMTFVIDRRARYAYYVDRSGNLFRYDLNTPTVAANQVVAQSAIGATILAMTMALDNSMIYATTSSHTILGISTTTFAVTSLAGNGSQGSTDGTGTAATLGQLGGIALDITTGTQLVFMEADTGNIRTVSYTGVVTTRRRGALSGPFTNMSVDMGSHLWMGGGEQMFGFNLYSGTLDAGVSVPGNIVGPVCCDTASGGAAYLYYFAAGPGSATGAVLQRHSMATGAVVTLCTLPNTVCQQTLDPRAMFFRASGIYVVDSGGYLYRIVG